ncbi:MAG: GNAT family N-acetyltransferase [Clostridia bacterium]|nr:GNAT family N-acetyltransferase [Clostridia bacterium]
MINMWKGEKVRLRAAVPDDSGLYIDGNGNINTDVERCFEKIDFPYSAQMRSAMLEKAMADNKGDDFLFTVENNDGEAVGQLVTFDCDARMGCFKYGLFFTEKAQHKGYATEAVKILLDYYFNQLRYHKANVYVYDFNVPSQRFHEKMGFKKEGTLREVAYIDGEYHDAIYYGITANEF